MNFRLALLAIGCLVAGRTVLHAQGAPDSAHADAADSPPLSVDPRAPDADYERLLELLGRAPARPWLLLRGSDPERRLRAPSADAGPWAARLRQDVLHPPGAFRLLPVQLYSVYNSAYPVPAADGPLWAGRGESASVAFGFTARAGPLTVQLDPMATYQENRAFAFPASTIPGYSPYLYFRHGATIDWPQRFGDRAFGGLDPGQSAVRLDVAGFAAGASTENLWWGPARFEPILMSDAGPGIPHVFIGTGRPKGIGIGTVEARAVWGHLSESKYFDADPTNDTRLFAGFVGGFTPRPFPALSVGGARTYVEAIPAGGLSLSRQILDAYHHAATNLRMDNQLLELFARFAPPGSGLEAYAEWAREDSWSTLRDLSLEPDHSQGYTLGFQAVVPRDGRWYRIYGELTHLGTSASLRTGRGDVTFYVHGDGVSYTQRGQLIGAPIGPGSNAETLGGDVFTAWGRVGLLFRRVAHDDDAYYALFAPWYDYRGSDVELVGGLEGVVFLGPIQASWSASYRPRYNRDFLDLNGQQAATSVDRDLRLELGLGWIPALPGNGAGGRR